MDAPKQLNDITIDYIIAYCQEKKEVKWLKEVALAPAKPDKNGHERKTSFFEIRNAFARKFFPDLAPKAAKEKKPTMWDKIEAL